MDDRWWGKVYFKDGSVDTSRFVSSEVFDFVGDVDFDAVERIEIIPQSHLSVEDNGKHQD